MTDLTITESFFICATQDKGKILTSNTAGASAFLAALLLELEETGTVSLGDARVLFEDEPDYDLEDEVKRAARKIREKNQPIEIPDEVPAHLVPMYKVLKGMDDRNYREIVRIYESSFGEWKINAIRVPLGDSLAEKKYLIKAKLGVFSNNRTYYFPQKGVLEILMTEVLYELTAKAYVGEEEAVLWFLLEEGSCIPACVSEEDKAEARARIDAEIMKNPEGKPARAKKLYEALMDKAISSAGSTTEYYKRKYRK